SQWGMWYMFGDDGRIVTGLRDWFGSTYYFDPSTYLKVTNDVVNVGNNTVAYFNDWGQLAYKTSNSFIGSLLSGAIQTWKQYGILPSLSIAQAICESSWGNAAPGNNLFGIKGSYNGMSQLLWTWEVYNGRSVHIQDWFRAYPSLAESIQDHGRFLYVNSRYSNLLWNRNYVDVCYKIKQDGYATSPTYATTLINIIEYNGLNWIDQAL
ncbi:glycoside hydrolase family 73 protein, partial [Fructilactobacillus florum]